ncbi:transcriptional regulator NrdR [Georgenia sp. EYE_87]|uniref:transcriptional regulator NrdR n=1 Tax=Georgenia sp. EYE_87 TaxID=2853448 RepID=UPI002004B708|nr:transcriptional regulator NrdR [Georgenia sp. EYE_87]MCK6212323.1 transcriptional regulator NrdR [Georgenia sp. EYE_87]
MHCPFCRHADTRVIDSRTAEDGSAIRRRRQCPSCGRRFSTVETSSLTVVKRSGASEPFSRDKVVAGVRKACQGRPVSDDDLALLAQQVEESLRAAGAAQIDAHEIGLAILGPLRQLDEVAYLRFASVYSSFSSLEDFEDAIAILRAERAERSAAGSGARAGQGDEEQGDEDHGAGERAGREPADEQAAAAQATDGSAPTADGFVSLGPAGTGREAPAR